MNEVAQPALKLVLPALQGTVPAAIGADHGRELQAIWKAIFERTQSDGVAADSVRDEQVGRSAGGSSDVGGKSDVRERVAADVGLKPDLQRAATRSVRAVDVGLKPDLQRAATRSVWLRPDLQGAATGSVWVRPDLQRAATVSVRAVGRALARLPDTSAARTPVPQESVIVFIRGQLVAVVVRNAHLTAEAALQCAFETAQELSGERAALRSLVVNGRTLFESGAPDLSRPGALVLAC